MADTDTDEAEAEAEKKLTVKCTGADLELWKNAAHTRKVTLSEWVRRVLTATAEKTVG